MAKRMSYLNIGDQQFKIVDEDSKYAVDAEAVSRMNADAAEASSRRTADDAIRNMINNKSLYNPPDFSKIVTIEALVSGANKSFTSQGGWYAADARNLLMDGGMCHVQISSSAKVISYSAASSSNEYGNHKEMTSWSYFPEGTQFSVTAVFTQDGNLYYAPPLDLPDEEITVEQDPELLDIRVGYSGTTYDTAGDAVRGQANLLRNGMAVMGNSIALPFTTATAYTIGDYCRRDGNLYRFVADHAKNVAWDASHVEQVTVVDELKELFNISDLIGTGEV